MKGRTTCPKCKHEFILDVENDEETHKATCPNCNNDFNIKTSEHDKDEGCTWEEHGEPRKTILSSIKPRTNKPMIAAVLLVIVFSMGITTAVFSETFLETSIDIASGIGIKGTVEISIINHLNQSIDNVSVTINNDTIDTDIDGLAHLENVTLGVQSVYINKSGHKNIEREILVLPFIVTGHEIKIKEGIENTNVAFDTLGCSLIFAILSVFSLISAVACLKREHFDVAVAGSIIGLFSIGFFLIGAVISIICLLYTSDAADE